MALPKTPTGIRGLDEITGGGLPTGRPTLVAGGAGCGKTLLSMEFLLRGATEFGEPGVFIAFEETADELAANVASLGFDLKALIAEKKIAVDYVLVERSDIEAAGDYDLGGLFIRIEHAITSVGAKRVVLDTVEALFSAMPDTTILRAELRRLFRWLKDRGMYVLKSRGMAHSNQIREFTMSERGVALREAYIGPAGVLTGTARSQQEARDVAERGDSEELVRQQLAVLEYKRQAVEAQVAALRSGLAADDVELERALLMTEQRTQRFSTDRSLMRHARQTEPVAPASPPRASRHTETRRDDE